MSNYVIPIIIIIIITYGIIKKRNIYEDFLSGAKEGLILTYNIIPPILAIVFAINIFIKSNIINDSLFYLKHLINIELEVIPMIILRPISGTATLAILQNIFKLYGPDSLVGYLASTIQGCTDTTIYVLALYFGSIKVYKTRYALLVGLFADFIGIISAIVVVSFFYS